MRRWPKEVDLPVRSAVAGGRAIPVTRARLRVFTFDEERDVSPGAVAVEFEASLPAGSTRLETWFTSADGKSRGAYYVSVKRVAAQ